MTITDQQSQSQATLVGRTIDERYQVERLLGAGAMGAVYIVRHLRLGKRFAMKVIHGELAQVPEFVARFEQEAKACSFLSHPNCIAVTDFGRAKTGELYLVMEYVEGEPLGEALARGPLEAREALLLIREVLAGLEHAHGAGIIHRDMKLDNVMRVSLGQRLAIKILDFGIAKVPVSGPDGKLTQAGVIFGTPETMAPEQAVSTQVDARADLYAVAVMLYQLLVGEAPFVADDYVALLNRKIVEPAPSLEGRAPGRFSEALVAFVAHGLEREPGKRFGSAEEMLGALEGLPELAGVVAPRATGPVRATSASTSHAGEVAFASTAVLGAGAAASAGEPTQAGVAARARNLLIRGRGWLVSTVGGYWRCDDFPDQAPSWGLRGKALFTTARGASVLGLALAPLLLLVLVLAVGGDEPTAALVTLPPKASVKARSAVAGANPVVKRPTRPSGISDATEKRLIAVRLFLAKKACREASLDLRNLLREQPTLAGAHYLLGAAEVCRRHFSDGLGAYEKAIALDPRYAGDARIIEDVRRMLRYRKLRQRVLTFIDSKLGKAGLDLLANLAATSKRREVRRGARQRLKARGAEGRIDEVLSLCRDLLQTRGCKKKRAIVARLRALGDARALPTLRRARRAKGGFLGLEKVNGCIYKDLSEAIEALEKK